MLNNLTNFFNLIVGRRIKTQLEPSDLIAVGTKQSPTLGDYKPTAIKFEDFVNSLPFFKYSEKIIKLTSAQIKTLGSSIELLEAPGADKYYVIDRIQIEYKFGTAAYIFPTSPSFYLDGCFDSYVIKTLLTGLTNSVCVITGNLRNTITVGSGSGSVQVITNRDILNSNLVIGTPNGDDPTTGDGEMIIKIYYKIETI